ncbi:uncharacterized protein LOC131024564 isoform X1 [Salvia miltiorrhiza]|uniref:uncharacterized protein LOC131024564 isoform X1 n=1 Tax=Salvia miltiorrhiza TaxID=226208 RepID=UPI0025AC04B6|nr:uncharacterized protein LOC131024564 isoform X1 [Salvia miltiorrhiza]
MATKGAAGDGGRGDSRVIYTGNKKERRALRLENPFTLKVGQVFTGFGVGCGVGIGIGRPINLGAIPVLGQVMSATRGATDVFSGVQRHVNNSLKKVGAKNIEAGIGCGVGFGHGFGVGLAVKPSVLHQIQSQFLQVATLVMERLGIDSSSTLSVNQGMVSPPSLQSGKSMVDEASYENRSMTQLAKSSSNNRNGTALFSPEGTLAPTSAATDTKSTSRTERVLNNFLQNLKEEGSSSQEQARASHLENKVLQMVLKHQVLIEELMQENDKLRQILVDELKVEPSRLQSSATSRSKSSCNECFECRRRQRRRSNFA